MDTNARGAIGMADWVALVCELPLRYRQPGAGSIRALFAPADDHLDDRAVFIVAVSEWIHEHRNIVEAWRYYSEDKRSSPTPYFRRPSAPLVVGFFDKNYTDERRYADETTFTDEVDACADFIYGEACWSLRRHRVQEFQAPSRVDDAEA